MKNTIKVLGIVSLALVIAMAAGCASLTLVSMEQDTVAGPKQVGQGQDIDPKLITVWGNYQDGSRKVVSLSASNITFDKNAAGTQTVRVRVSNQEVTFQTQVMPLLSLTLVSPPAKLTYYRGEQLDLAGLRVNGAWSGLPAAELKVDASNITGFNSNTLGSQRLTITLNGRSVNFNITVSAPPQIPVIYRFTGEWTSDLTGSTSTPEGTVTVGASTITTTMGINLTGVYTSGGGSSEYGLTWAYLYDASGKIGFTYNGQGAIALALGKTACEPMVKVLAAHGQTLVTSDMQDVHKGIGLSQRISQ